ncbi:hypothetical protein D3C81_1360510 [compost metagenome]
MSYDQLPKGLFQASGIDDTSDFQHSGQVVCPALRFHSVQEKQTILRRSERIFLLRLNWFNIRIGFGGFEQLQFTSQPRYSRRLKQIAQRKIYIEGSMKPHG